MPEFSQDITVDLNVELTNNVLNSVHVNQYEHKSRKINIYVKKDGVNYPIPNNLTVNIRIHKSNGYDIYKTIGKDIGTISGNKITFLIEESMTIAPGRQACDIEFIDTNGNRLYSTKFYLNVHKSALDDNNIKDTDDYSTVQSLARESKEYANLSESYAVGTDNEIRENDSTDNAKYYKEQAELNADNALEYSENAQKYSVSAANSAESASASAENASNIAQQAANSSTQAGDSAATASNKATQSANYAKEAESFTHGGTNTRENEDTDNSKYYYEQAKSISESLSGALRPMGTMNYSLFVDTVMSTASEGDMYNISDEFTTNPNFKEGSGLKIPAGANIYKTADGMWDVLAGSPVGGVKGDAESIYRKGNVNITPANIGLGNVDNIADVDKSVAYAVDADTVDGKHASDLQNYNNLTNKPTIPTVGNGTVTIKQAGTQKGTFTMNQSGNTTIELADNNTWRGIQNNLTSTSTTDSLSANQGRILNNKLVRKVIWNGDTTGNIVIERSKFPPCLFYTINYNYGLSGNITDFLISTVDNNYVGTYTKMLVASTMDGQLIQELKEPLVLTFSSNQVTLTRGNMYFYNIYPSVCTGSVSGQSTLIKINGIIGYIPLA